MEKLAGLPVIIKLELSDPNKDGFIHLTKENNKFNLNITLGGLSDLLNNGYMRLFFDLIYKFPENMTNESYYDKDFVCSQVIEIEHQVEQIHTFSLEFEIEEKRFDQYENFNIERKKKSGWIIKDPFVLEARYSFKHDGEMGISASLESGKFMEINVPVTIDTPGDII